MAVTERGNNPCEPSFHRHSSGEAPSALWAANGEDAMAALLVFLSPLVFLGIVAVAMNDALRNYIPRPMDEGGQERPVTAD
jgi:hypothetical protein